MAVIVTIRMPDSEYNKIKKLVEKKLYLSVSDFVRSAVRKELEKYFENEEVE